MDFLTQPDFARAMNLLFSFEDSLTDGPVNEFARMSFESMVQNFLSQLDYDKGYAHYDYKTNVIKAKIWKIDDDDDIIVVYINAETLDTEISYIDKEDRTPPKTFMRKLRDFLRIDITVDPVTMDLKFKMSERIPYVERPKLSFDVEQKLMTPGIKTYKYGK